jgi:hypothetical protein
MKTIAARRRAAFFYPRPLLLDPAANRVLVALQSPALGLLRTPAQAVKQASDMVDVIGHAEALLDDLRNPRTGPQIRIKPRRLCAFEQKAFELAPGFGVELRRTTGRRSGPERCRPLLPIGRLPAPHTPPIHADHVRHLHRRQTLGQQLDGAPSSTFQFLCASGRSHGTPPDQRMGHYLCRIQ